MFNVNSVVTNPNNLPSVLELDVINGRSLKHYNLLSHFNLVVGAGLSGSVIAQQASERSGLRSQFLFPLMILPKS